MKLSQDKLRSLALRLQGHHSADHRFLARIGRFIPSMADHKESWKCLTCKKIAKATAQFCAHCGQHWSEVWDQSFAHAGRQNNYANAANTSSRSQWPELPARSPSRRSRQRNAWNTRKGEGKGKSTKKDAGKGGNGSKGKTQSGPRANAPKLQAEVPWSPPVAPTPPPAPPVLQPQQLENMQVKQLLSALKKVSADLPPEVQAAMQKMHGDDDKQLTKQLHSAVSQRGNSKKSLAELTSARANLHSSWNAFLESAITRWERYSEEFTQQDKDLASQIEKAKETMKACKEHFRSLQALEGSAASTAEVISDEEENSIPSKVDVHMQQMQDSLKLLKGGMEEELRGLKRQRLEDAAPNAANSAVGDGGADASLCGQGGK